MVGVKPQQTEKGNFLFVNYISVGSLSSHTSVLFAAELLNLRKCLPDEQTVCSFSKSYATTKEIKNTSWAKRVQKEQNEIKISHSAKTLKRKMQLKLLDPQIWTGKQDGSMISSTETTYPLEFYRKY